MYLEDNSESKILRGYMEAGKIPIMCNVLYDQGGALPAVDVFDPDEIVELYNLLSQVTIEGPSEMSVTDAYHHITFELQNGLQVSYSFEDNLLVRKDGNYEVANAAPLWAKVREIQDAYLARAAEKGTHKLTIASGEDLIWSYPHEAVPGDLVCVRVADVTDVFMYVTYNGEDAENWGDMYFTFTMPDKDVQLKAYAATPPGGGLA